MLGAVPGRGHVSQNEARILTVSREASTLDYLGIEAIYWANSTAIEYAHRHHRIEAHLKLRTQIPKP